MAGRAGLQPMFHWIFQWAAMSTLPPYLTHPSWFLNTPCPVRCRLPFSITPSSFFSTTPLPLHPLRCHLLFSISAASSFPSARCGCPQLPDCLPCALPRGICPHPRLSRRLCWRLQTFASSPGLSLGPRCLHTTDCTCSVGLLGALTHSPSKSPPHLLTHLASPHLLWGPPPSSCATPGPLTPPGACPETGQCPAALALPWGILWGQPWTRRLGMLNPPRPHLLLMVEDPGLDVAAT